MQNDWNALTDAQKRKVMDLKGNDWENITVEIKPYDDRHGARTKQSYEILLIKWQQNGKNFQTTISSQVGSHHARKKI